MQSVLCETTLTQNNKQAIDDGNINRTKQYTVEYLKAGSSQVKHPSSW